MNNKLFKVIQNLILQNAEKKVLILNHKTGRWLLPGGKIAEGEEWFDGLKRELKEETNIDDFKLGRVIDVDSYSEGNDNFYVVTFSASVDSVKIKLSSEHKEYAQISQSEMDKYPFWHPSIKKRLEKFWQI